MSLLAIGLVLLFVALMLIRVPMGIACGAVTLLFLFIGGGSITPRDIIMSMFQAVNSFPLLSVPLFILAGQFMATGGIAKYFLELADELVGSMKGGYALVTILACLFFADLSGSAPATVAAIGTLMIPAMVKQGYSPAFAAGICACAGVLGVIIPPSNPMIIYALTNNVSLGKLFLAGFMPGLVLVLGMAIPAYLIARKNNWGGTERKRSLRGIARAFWKAKWALLVPVVILGGIYSGLFTPTESAAVACIYSAIIGLFVYKQFTWRDIPGIFRAAAVPVFTVFMILMFASGLGLVMTMQGVPQALTAGIQSVTDSPIVTLLIINVLLLFIGLFMDQMAAIIIISPLLLTVLTPYGVDPLHFGMIFIMNLGIGFVTPPFGGNLFMANQISKLNIVSVFRASLPLIIGMLIALLTVTFVPEITLFLPNLFYK